MTEKQPCSSNSSSLIAVMIGAGALALASFWVGMAAGRGGAVEPIEAASSGLAAKVDRVESIDGFYMASFGVLMKTYYGSSASVLSASFGPGGTVIGRVQIEGKERTAVMLPDARTVILGEIRSIFLPEGEIGAGNTRGAGVENGAATDNVAVQPGSITQHDSPVVAQETSPPRGVPSPTPAGKPLQPSAERAADDTMASGARPPAIQPPEGMKGAKVANKPALYAAAGKSGGYVSFGHGPKKLYVFFDPNCPACREASKFINDKVAGAEVEVRYLPLSILGPDSQDKAAYILEGKDNEDRQARFNAAHTAKKMSEIVPGFSYKAAPSGDRGALVNFALLKASGQVSTPRFMYQTVQGPMISVITSEKGLMEIIGSISHE